MRTVHSLSHPLKVRDQKIGFVITGITTGNEDRIQTLDLAEVIFLKFQSGKLFVLFRQLDQDGNPDPMIDIVFIAQFGELDVHFLARVLHQPAWSIILPGNVFHAIGSEDDHFAEILIELLNGPRIPTIGIISIADLMASNRTIGRFAGLKSGIDRNLTGIPIQRSQQLTNAKHRSSRVMPRDRDSHRTTTHSRQDTDREPFGLFRYRI